MQLYRKHPVYDVAEIKKENCSMTSGSEVMCRKKVKTPWSIYRDFAVAERAHNLPPGN